MRRGKAHTPQGVNKKKAICLTVPNTLINIERTIEDYESKFRLKNTEIDLHVKQIPEKRPSYNTEIHLNVLILAERMKIKNTKNLSKMETLEQKLSLPIEYKFQGSTDQLI